MCLLLLLQALPFVEIKRRRLRCKWWQKCKAQLLLGGSFLGLCLALGTGWSLLPSISPSWRAVQNTAGETVQLPRLENWMAIRNMRQLQVTHEEIMSSCIVWLNWQCPCKVWKCAPAWTASIYTFCDPEVQRSGIKNSWIVPLVYIWVKPEKMDRWIKVYWCH